MPYLVLTDLDNRECAPSMIQEWLPVTRNHNLIFRIAVREVESWILADRKGFAKFLGIAQKRIPENPDDLIDPKAELIHLARASRKRDLMKDLVPREGSTARQGPAYTTSGWYRIRCKFETDRYASRQHEVDLQQFRHAAKRRVYKVKGFGTK